MLKTVSRIERRVPAARIAANEEPYSTSRRSPRWYQTRCGIRWTSGLGAGRDRRQADRRQRGEGADAAAVASRARRGTRAPGARPLSTASSNTAGVRPSITTRISFLGPATQSRARMRRPAWRSGRAPARAPRARARRPPRGSRPPGRRRARRARARPGRQNGRPGSRPAARERAGDDRRRGDRAQRAARSARRRPRASRLRSSRAAAPSAAAPTADRESSAWRGAIRPDERAFRSRCRGRARRRSSTTPTSRGESRRGSATLVASLEPADHGEAELGGARAVDDAVVERDGDRAHRPDDDLAVAHDRALGDPADAEDRHLRVVDDRRREEAAELAGARDRERRAAELLRRERAGARGLGQPLDLGGELLDGGASQPRTTGTTRPWSVCTATPMS